MRILRAGFAAILVGVLLSFAAPAVLPAAAVSAAPVSAATVLPGSVSQPVAGQQAPAPGPVIDPRETDRANAKKTKSKIIVGVLVVVLGGIVLFGRHLRSKARKKTADQAKGK